MGITRRHLAMMGIALAAVLLWLAADRLIMTDKKRIRAAIDQMAAAVEQGDVDKLFAHISPTYADEAHSYEKLRLLAEGFLRHHDDLSINVREVKVNVTGAAAMAQVRVLASQSGEGSSVSAWQLQFQRESDGRWLVVSLTPLRINTRDVSGWKSFYEQGWE